MYEDGYFSNKEQLFATPHNHLMEGLLYGSSDFSDDEHIEELNRRRKRSNTTFTSSFMVPCRYVAGDHVIPSSSGLSSRPAARFDVPLNSSNQKFNLTIKEQFCEDITNYTHCNPMAIRDSRGNAVFLSDPLALDTYVGEDMSRRAAIDGSDYRDTR